MGIFSKYNSHIGAFLLGAMFSGLFFAGQLKEPVISWEDSSKRLTGAVFFADITQNEPLQLVRTKVELTLDEFAVASTTEEATTTLAVASTTALTASTTASTTDTIAEEETLAFKEDSYVVEEIVEPTLVERAVAALPPEPEVVEIEAPPEVVEEEERVLPDGVFLLESGMYVDHNGKEVSGDPYAYNYKPPPKEEEFTTPGGVVMDRFGNILHTPEVVDESLVLIPPTIIDPENPPSTVSPIYIPRYVVGAIERNSFFTCVQLSFYQNERALCELYKERKDHYQWIKVDELEE